MDIYSFAFFRFGNEIFRRSVSIVKVGLDNFSFSRLAENYDIGIITKISILKVEDSLTRWYSNVIFRSVKWHKNRTGMDACGSIRVGAARFLKTMHFEYIIAHCIQFNEKSGEKHRYRIIFDKTLLFPYLQICWVKTNALKRIIFRLKRW